MIVIENSKPTNKNQDQICHLTQQQIFSLYSNLKMTDFCPRCNFRINYHDNKQGISKMSFYYLI